METKRLLEMIKGKHRGTFARIVYVKELPVYSEFKEKIRVQQIVESTYRMGCVYSNLQSVRQNNLEGVSKEYKLPYGEWSSYPYIITYKGVDFLRVTKTKNESRKERYYIFDIEEQVGHYVPFELIAEFVKPLKRNENVVSNLKIKNIISIKWCGEKIEENT